MAEKKPKKETEAQKTANAARAAYQKAKEAKDKTDNAQTKAALDKATELMRAAVKVENRERFINVGNSRTKKARAAIRQLVKVANPKSYDFTAAEGEKIVSGLMVAVDEVRKAFATSGKSVNSGDDFSL